MCQEHTFIFLLEITFVGHSHISPLEASYQWEISSPMGFFCLFFLKKKKRNKIEF